MDISKNRETQCSKISKCQLKHIADRTTLGSEQKSDVSIKQKIFFTEDEQKMYIKEWA